MSKDSFYQDLKSKYAGITDEASFSYGEIYEAIANLSDAELSLNLLPLGNLVAKSGNVKYTKLLAEAGRRLAESGFGAEFEENESGYDYEPLSDRAKATIIHALDQYISLGANEGLPFGCTHFDAFEGGAPTVEETEGLIDVLQSYDGLATFSEFGNELEGTLGEPVSVQEAQAQNDAPVQGKHPLYSASGVKSILEALYGEALTPEKVENLTEFFGSNLAEMGESPEYIAKATETVRTGLLGEIAKAKTAPAKTGDPVSEYARTLITATYGSYTPATIRDSMKGYGEHLRKQGFTEDVIDDEVASRTEQLLAVL